MGVPYFSGGGVGVFVFFVLSGFLITTLLLDERQTEGRLHLTRFYARRALRLLPALGILLIASVGGVLLLGGVYRDATLASILPTLFYYANWEVFFHGFDSLGLFAHMWSLSVEEQFYLIWPPCLIGMRRWSTNRVLLALVAVSTAVLALRLAVYDGAADQHLTLGTHELADQLAIGCALAVAFRAYPSLVASISRYALLPAIALLLVTIDVWHPNSDQGSPRFFYTVGFTLIALSAAALIGYVHGTPASLVSRGLALKPLVYLGRISYGMYLFHFAIVSALATIDWSHSVEFYLLAYASTVVAASLSFFLVERRFLKLKGRFEATSIGRQRSQAEARAGLGN
jgi:peptidoglycan/LPS O-acetylase OafA/YrhL